jgi:hypothetical protein
MHTKDIPLIRLLLGYIEEADGDVLNNLKELSETTYMAYIKISE